MNIFRTGKGDKDPKPTKPKWPTVAFAESGSEAADEIASARKKKKKGTK